MGSNRARCDARHDYPRPRHRRPQNVQELRQPSSRLASPTNRSCSKSRAMITDPARSNAAPILAIPTSAPCTTGTNYFRRRRLWSGRAGCRTAGIGCIERKMSMAGHLIKWIEPVRARREEYAASRSRAAFSTRAPLKAREVAQKQMARVREAVFNLEREGGSSCDESSGKSDGGRRSEASGIKPSSFVSFQPARLKPCPTRRRVTGR